MTGFVTISRARLSRLVVRSDNGYRTCVLCGRWAHYDHARKRSEPVHHKRTCPLASATGEPR